MKILIIILAIAAGCSTGSYSTSSNMDLIKGNTWRTYDYKENGIANPAVVAHQPTFEFRANGKMYFSQINPAFLDTFDFTFTSETNIRLTKPASPNFFLNMQVDQVSIQFFDFTLTDSQTTDFDSYKTEKL